MRQVDDRIILHSDCNCFYAAVEMLHDPKLRDVPMAVGGDPEARRGTDVYMHCGWQGDTSLL